jgi:murein DD-endopeptidase MepM/ murein hydrolase activator NlpD
MRKTLVPLLILIMLSPLFAFAQSTSDIQKSIDLKNAEIQALQNEINQYQAQVDAVAAEANTLQSTLNGISQNQKKLQKSLTLTGKSVEKTTLTIKQNEQEIGSLGQGIVKNTVALNETIRALHIADNKSLIELLASQKSVSEFMRDVDEVLLVQSEIKDHVSTMRVQKSSLETSQTDLAKKKKELEQLNGQLADQKKVVDVQAKEKADLLARTKNEESAYQAELDARRKQVEALTAEIFEYESKLKFTLDKGMLPGQGALAWPVASVVITQRFGKTVDARRLYVSGSHSGVDFRAAVGTPVYAVADGTIEGTGDTDKTCYKASFGKWVFIRHDNGLATAYGHLSVIKAVDGQVVKKGDLIAYSGNTGHSTAPHLHLTVYASNGVNGEEGARVADRPSTNSACKGRVYRMPIAPTSAYLDPLLYLSKATSSMFKDGGAQTSE